MLTTEPLRLPPEGMSAKATLNQAQGTPLTVTHWRPHSDGI
ncbi:MAG: hypothetical protein WB867_06400 [Candidatus Dormiibacterota bacterium]